MEVRKCWVDWERWRDRWRCWSNVRNIWLRPGKAGYIDMISCGVVHFGVKYMGWFALRSPLLSNAPSFARNLTLLLERYTVILLNIEEKYRTLAKRSAFYRYISVLQKQSTSKISHLTHLATAKTHRSQVLCRVLTQSLCALYNSR